MRLSAEERLLLALCREEADFNVPADWDRFYRLVQDHKLSPLIHHNLKKMGGMVSAPSKIMDQMRTHTRTTALANLLYEQKIYCLLKLFNQDGIETIPIKGITFSKMIYGKNMVRETCDIDLLIRKKDVLKVDAILRGLSFTPTRDFAVLKNWQDVYSYGHYLKDEPLTPRYIVDIHWDFLPPEQSRPALLKKAWKRATPTEIDGNQIMVLSPEDILLFLSVKFAMDHIQRFLLRSICDIANFLKVYKEKLDWGYILQECNRNKIATHLYFALYFSEKLFGVDFPMEVRRKLKPTVIKRWLFKPLIQRRIFSKKSLTIKYSISYLICYFLPTILSISSPRDIFWSLKVVSRRGCCFITKKMDKNFRKGILRRF
ncbi:MAG: nucleotidyltransferase family protein [Candidatus Omnitrophica bacterium]|nr:nucleotidyltransferase family protein [Candidatus Omnitrophota bacterium]